MKWMMDSFDEILTSFGSSSFTTWIIDGFLSTSNSQSDIDLVNQFVKEHTNDLQGMDNFTSRL